MAKAKSTNNAAMVGKIALVIGLLLAVVGGLIQQTYQIPYAYLILVILGAIVGFINIAEKNVVTLLLGIVALTVVGNATLNVIPAVNMYLIAILTNFLAFIGAAGFIVALKAILQVSKI